VARLFDPRRADDVQARIPVRRRNGFPGVEADAHPHGSAWRPRRGREGPLALHRRCDRLGGPAEHHEERVALRIDFPTLIRGEGGP
jgi:hypothetical protein